jgi:hypothetical protein
LRCGRQELVELAFQRAKSACLDVIWELPYFDKTLDFIHTHSHQIRSLSLITNYYYRQSHTDGLPFSNCSWSSLRHVFLAGSSTSAMISMYSSFLSGLKLDEVALEIEVSYETSRWFIGISIWEHVTNLTIHYGMMYLT